MSLAILFHSLCTQHVLDINKPIIRSLELCCWNYHIGRFVLGSLCVGDSVRLGLSSVRVAACNTDTTQTQPHQIANTQRTENKMTDAEILTAQSQTLDGGYINVRNMLST